jgi:hypothetical protein
MFRVTIRHDVIDYETWKASFDEWVATGVPASEGVRDHTTYRDSSDSNNATATFDFDDEDAAQMFIMNPAHRRVLEHNGVKQANLLISIVEL